MTKFLAAALALASLTATGAATAATPAEPGQSTVVRYFDLDLASFEGRAELQRRMRHAVNLVCPRGFSGDVGANMDRSDCLTYARASAERGTQEAMLHRFSGVEVAVVGLSGR